MQHPKVLLVFLLAHLSRGKIGRKLYQGNKNIKLSGIFGIVAAGLDEETALGRLVVTGVTVPQYGVEGKHAVLYCRSTIRLHSKYQSEPKEYRNKYKQVQLPQGKHFNRVPFQLLLGDTSLLR